MASENTRGALFMSLSMAAFTANDTCMKLVTERLSIYPAAALRGLVVVVALAAIARAQGRLQLALPRREARLVAARCAGEVASTVAYLLALQHMPLANISAVMQSLPLAVSLGAAVFLHEPVGWRRAGAILLGFAGVMLILRPGTEGFDEWSLLALASVAAVVLRDLTTRALGKAVPSAVVAIWSAGSVTVGAALAVPFAGGWPILTGGEAAVLLLAAACLVVGYVASINAMRVGEVGAVVPFRYTALVWALGLGWLVFGQWPRPLTVAGAGLVVATGLFTLWRERMVRRRAFARG